MMRALILRISPLLIALLCLTSDVDAQQTEGFYIVVDSSAQLLVVDPLGRREGVDPVVGLTHNEIPASMISDESTPSLNSEPGDQTGDVHEFMTNPEFQPLVGAYLIRLFGMQTALIKLTISFKVHDSCIVRENHKGSDNHISVELYGR
jgi:hypothetical protein